jgi:protein-arginine kinase activator protein McsA
MLLRHHGSCYHIGRTYRTAVSTTPHEVEHLQRQLDTAIKEEAFELAASIRDKLRIIAPQLKHAAKHATKDMARK